MRPAFTICTLRLLGCSNSSMGNLFSWGGGACRAEERSRSPWSWGTNWDLLLASGRLNRAWCTSRGLRKALFVTLSESSLSVLGSLLNNIVSCYSFCSADEIKKDRWAAKLGVEGWERVEVFHVLLMRYYDEWRSFRLTSYCGSLNPFCFWRLQTRRRTAQQILAAFVWNILKYVSGILCLRFDCGLIPTGAPLALCTATLSKALLNLT